MQLYKTRVREICMFTKILSRHCTKKKKKCIYKKSFCKAKVMRIFTKEPTKLTEILLKFILLSLIVYYSHIHKLFHK